jgi:hypothetical protein
MNADVKLENPFRPGAGHYPPFLAGRADEIEHCKRLFSQQTILHNIIITGLRGVGKTSLLTALKPIGIQMSWLWSGTDMSESTSVSEDTIAIRLITDLSIALSSITIKTPLPQFGFSDSLPVKDAKLNYSELLRLYNSSPGLIADKLKYVLEYVWEVIKMNSIQKGIIFAYDEVQTMQDHVKKDQYPLSVLLDVFQSIQKKNIPFMLLLTGLPTLFPKLVATRTYSERMFEKIFLKQLTEDASREAIEKPIQDSKQRIGFTKESIDTIVNISGRYPYFIQFICKEVFDIFIQRIESGNPPDAVPTEDLLRKLDSDFFSSRWEMLSDRQRELLWVVASLDSAEEEFTVQEVNLKSKEILDNPFGSSHITQMFSTLFDRGILYRNRHGKYSFAVPLFNQFIKRQFSLPAF